MIDARYLELGLLMLVLFVLVAQSVASRKKTGARASRTVFWPVLLTTGGAMSLVRLMIFWSVVGIEHRTDTRYGPVPVMGLLKPEVDLFVPRGPITSKELLPSTFFLVGGSLIIATVLASSAAGIQLLCTCIWHKS